MNTSAGWYPDPNEPDKERYWDGLAWTTEQRVRNVSSDPQPWGGQWASPAAGDLGDLFSDNGSAGEYAARRNPALAGGRPNEERSWWEESADVHDETRGLLSGSTGSQVNPWVDPPRATPQWEGAAEPTVARAGSSRRRGVVPRVGAGLLLLFALFVANAQRERAEVPPPPVVDNVPASTTESPLPAEPSEYVDDRSALPGAVDEQPLEGKGEPEASADALERPDVTRTPAAEVAGELPMEPVDVYGSAFGPGGLLAVTWMAPDSAPRGVRYLVEVRSGNVVRSVRTSSTETMFKKVPSRNCWVTITPYTAQGKGPVVRFRCGE